MKKALLLSLSVILSAATFAQVQDRNQWTCSGVQDNLYTHLNAGKVVIIAMQGLDCSGCNGNAPFLDTFATNNKAKVRVWSALQLMAGSGGTCAQVQNWLQTHGYNDVFTFLDSSNYWITNNPGAEWLVIHPADKKIKYSGYDMSKAFVEARKIFDPVSVKNIEAANSFKLYPNPANGIVHLQIEEAANVSIYSVDGKLVLSQQLIKGDNAIDIANLHSGMYMVNVINDNQVQRTILLKQ